MKKIILLSKKWLAFSWLLSFSSWGVQDAYHVEESVKKVNKETTITFTFKKGKNNLKVADILEGKAEVLDMLLTFTKRISELVEKHHLWNGFSLTSSVKDRSKDFSFSMKGKSYPTQSDPTKRKDTFMSYQGSSEGRYHEIRQKKPSDDYFKNAFDEHLTKVKKKSKDFKAIAFTSSRGGCLVTIPERKVTTIYDFSKEAGDEEIYKFWALAQKVWKTYKENIDMFRFNSGNTHAVQTVPHAHLRLEITGKRFLGKQLVGWDQVDEVKVDKVEYAPSNTYDTTFLVIILCITIIASTVVYFALKKQKKVHEQNED
ncbi:MAG: hypothetical protein AAF335_03505 [Bacteroidota bacterium]